MTNVFDVLAVDPRAPEMGQVEPVVVCSNNCYLSFQEWIMNFPYEKMMKTDLSNLQRIDTLFCDRCLEYAKSQNPLLLKEFVKRTYLKQPEFRVNFLKNSRTDTIVGEFTHKCKLSLAHNLEEVGRLEDAARIYEGLEMYTDARKMRLQDKERHVFVKRTDVSVNLNELLQQFKEGGIVAVYRCPHCGGKIKVGKDSNVESLKTCEHCGSEIQAMELADFIKTALS